MEIHLKKNQAAEIMFPMVDSASPASLKTGLTVVDTAYYKDGAGSWTALAITDAVTEISTTGMYTIEMTAGELNHDLIMIKLTVSGAADSVVVIRTFAVDIDGLVRSTTPANTLSVDASNSVDIGKWGGVDVTLSSTTAKPEIDVYSISDDAGAANNAELDYDGTGYNKSASEIATVNDITTKTGFSLSTAGIQAIWDALTSALTTASSIGKLLVDNINATISSRSSHTAANVWSVGTRELTAGTKDTEIDAIQTKTDNLPGDPASETNVDSNETKIDTLQTDVTAIKNETNSPNGAVVVDGSNTPSTFETNLTESDDDYWNDSFLKFKTGNLTNQVKRISDYDGASKFITVSGAFTETPADADTFDIINR